MKKLLLIAVLAIFALKTEAQTTTVHHYLPTLSASQAKNYASYDGCIFDPEVIFNSTENLRLLKKLNPDIQLICYINAVEWFDPMFNDKPWSKGVLQELKKHPQWWLKGTNGEQIEFWPGTKMANCRLDCPKAVIDGRNFSYIEYISFLFVRDVIGAYSREGIELSGVLVDELFPTIDWLGRYKKNQSGLDTDRDGYNDEKGNLNYQWQLGMISFIEYIRDKQGKSFIIIGNGGNGYYLESPEGKILCNGKQFENFPDIYLDENDFTTEAWIKNMNNASSMDVAIFNARPNADGYKSNWFFTICSTMLLDNAIFSDGQNKPYEAKYKLHLGDPKAGFSRSGNAFQRRYEKGIVFVDPYKKTSWIEYTNGKILKQ